MAAQGEFRVIQGRWFWYQSKTRIRLPISEQPWSCLAPFRRYGGVKVENRQFVPLWNFEMNQISAKTRVFGLSVGEEIITLTLFVLIQYQSGSDEQTDGHLCCSNSAWRFACIACYATAVVKSSKIFIQIWHDLLKSKDVFFIFQGANFSQHLSFDSLWLFFSTA